MFGHQALTLVLLAGVASAEDLTAVVAIDPCGDSGTARLTGQMRGALAEIPGIRVQSGEETVALLGGVPRGSLADATRLISGSRADLFQDAFVRAEQTLVAAISDLTRMSPTEATWKQLADAWTMLAQIQQRTGREAEAEANLRRVLNVDRDYAPDPDFYPPSFRRFVDALRRRIDVEASSSIRISTRPSKLIVSVDGSPIGESPVVLSVPAGEYRVEAAFPEEGGAARLVKVQGASAIELDSGFEGAVHRARGPCLAIRSGREAHLVALVRMASLLGAAQVVAVREEEPTANERYLVASLVKASSGEELREGRIKIYASGFPPGAAARLAAFLATGIAEPPVQPLNRGDLAAGYTHPDFPARTDLLPVMSAADEQIIQPVPMVDSKRRSRTPAWMAAAGAGAFLGTSVWQALGARATDDRLNQLRGDGAFHAGSEQEVMRLNHQLKSCRSFALASARDLHLVLPLKLAGGDPLRLDDGHRGGDSLGATA
jgi:hypothetical protein